MVTTQSQSYRVSFDAARGAKATTGRGRIDQHLLKVKLFLAWIIQLSGTTAMELNGLPSNRMVDVAQ